MKVEEIRKKHDTRLRLAAVDLHTTVHIETTHHTAITLKTLIEEHEDIYEILNSKGIHAAANYHLSRILELKQELKTLEE